MSKPYHPLFVILVILSLAISACASGTEPKNNNVVNNILPTATALPTSTPVPSLSDIVEQVSPSIVRVRSFSSQNILAGSGIIYSNEGIVITNAHNVEFATSAQIYLNGSDKALEADIIGVSPCEDIAVLDLIPEVSVQPAIIPDNSSLRIADEVIAIGYELNFFNNAINPSAHWGIINRTEIEYLNHDNLIQHEAQLNEGNSGGGLFNRDGVLIGINTYRILRSNAQGINLALNIVDAQQIWERLIEKRQPIGDEILFGMPQQGDISSAEDRDCWIFSGTQGTSIQIDVVGNDNFDIQVALYDPQNKFISYNDDVQSEKTASRLQVTLQSTGNYLVVVSLANARLDENESGTYQITIQEKAE